MIDYILPGIILTELSCTTDPDFKSVDPMEIKADFTISNKFSQDKKTLRAVLTAEIFKDIKNAPFHIKVSMEARFSGPEAELADFVKFNGPPTHIMPFMRELIASITQRSGHPPLILPPVNLSQLLSHSQRKSESDKKRVSKISR